LLRTNGYIRAIIDILSDTNYILRGRHAYALGQTLSLSNIKPIVNLKVFSTNIFEG
jgi:hypothetical protein